MSAINTGTLLFDSGGTLDGLLSGVGTLQVAGGTLQIAGSGDNTFSGTTNVTVGTLQLNRTGGNALGGTINFTGTGGLTLSQANQIADTAIINYDKGTNGGSIVLNETVAAINVLNGNDVGAQVQAANGFNVTGLLTAMNTGLFSVASNATGSVGGLNISGSAIIRVAANGNPSTLNVGAMGITASGGTVQVGQGTGAFDATLNLEGNVTTTGDLNFTDGNFTGAQLRQISLNSATHDFQRR
jgi:autotransporter family porin